MGELRRPRLLHLIDEVDVKYGNSARLGIDRITSDGNTAF
jgi:hypothetical protein